AAASLSGYFHALTDVTTGDLFHGRARRESYDPTWRVQHLPLPPVALWLSAGTGEPRELAALRGFVRVLPQDADVTTVVVPRAGHAFPSWAAVLPQALAWTSSRLPPPLAALPSPVS
ncbi:MAG: esterase, partial [Frankiales bacterium]|nr:esterase [Frankiales bacterium]